jgi:hypothetical protein
MDVGDQRARDVHTFKKEHTPAAPRDGPTTTEESSPPRTGHPWHAWGPSPGSIGVCVPNYFHDTCRQKGYAADWLFAFYARTCATLSAEQARRAVDEIKFWRAALAAELARTTPSARGPHARAAPSPDLYARAVDERRRRQGGG